MNNYGKLAVGLLTGVAVGATLGILLAPDKGSETRRKLAGSAGKLTDALRQRAEEGLDYVKSTAREKTGQLADDLSTSENNIQSRASEKYKTKM